MIVFFLKKEDYDIWSICALFFFYFKTYIVFYSIWVLAFIKFNQSSNSFSFVIKILCDSQFPLKCLHDDIILSLFFNEALMIILFLFEYYFFIFK
jgi:hypothetical protein